MDRGYWPASAGSGRATRSIRSPSAPRRWTLPDRTSVAGELGEPLGLLRSSSMRRAEVSQIGLREMDGGTLVGEPADVLGLVILGGGRPRDEDRRRPGDGDFGHRRRPAAADEEVGGRVDEVDPRLVADDLVDRARSPAATTSPAERRRRSAHRRRDRSPGRHPAWSLGIVDDGFVQRTRALATLQSRRARSDRRATRARRAPRRGPAPGRGRGSPAAPARRSPSAGATATLRTSRPMPPRSAPPGRWPALAGDRTRPRRPECAAAARPAPPAGWRIRQPTRRPVAAIRGAAVGPS